MKIKCSACSVQSKDKEKAKIVCLDEDGIYEKIFMIETTTSKDAEGEQDERI